MFTSKANKIFQEVIEKYHVINTVDQPFENAYPESDLLEHLLYRKSWIDTVQWHYEDIIRDPQIDPVAALKLKRQIDASNQDRTDMVEYIDSYFLDKYKNVSVKDNPTINTESPAWVLDRMSILCLKIYHMQEQTMRRDVDAAHLATCQNKLAILSELQVDLSTSFDQLMADIASGEKYMKVYRQMKMYNDEKLNPSLYKRQQN